MTLFLGRHLLLAVPPRTDLETATNPAKLLGQFGGCFRAADDALHSLFQLVVRERTLRLLQNFRRNYRFGFS